jgi:hypothetical protein
LGFFAARLAAISGTGASFTMPVAASLRTAVASPEIAGVCAALTAPF